MSQLRSHRVLRVFVAIVAVVGALGLTSRPAEAACTDNAASQVVRGTYPVEGLAPGAQHELPVSTTIAETLTVWATYADGRCAPEVSFRAESVRSARATADAVGSGCAGIVVESLEQDYVVRAVAPHGAPPFRVHAERSRAARGAEDEFRPGASVEYTVDGRVLKDTLKMRGFGSGQTDRFTLSIEWPTDIEIRTDDATCPCKTDTVVALYRREGQFSIPVAQDDDGGEGRCSRLVQRLQPGTYDVAVSGYGGMALAAYSVQFKRLRQQPVGLNDLPSPTLLVPSYDIQSQMSVAAARFAGTSQTLPGSSAGQVSLSDAQTSPLSLGGASTAVPLASQDGGSVESVSAQWDAGQRAALAAGRAPAADTRVPLFASLPKVATSEGTCCLLPPSSARAGADTSAYGMTSPLDRACVRQVDASLCKVQPPRCCCVASDSPGTSGQMVSEPLCSQRCATSYSTSSSLGAACMSVAPQPTPEGVTPHDPDRVGDGYRPNVPVERVYRAPFAYDTGERTGFNFLGRRLSTGVKETGYVDVAAYTIFGPQYRSESGAVGVPLTIPTGASRVRVRATLDNVTYRAMAATMLAGGAGAYTSANVWLGCKNTSGHELPMKTQAVELASAAMVSGMFGPDFRGSDPHRDVEADFAVEPGECTLWAGLFASSFSAGLASSAANSQGFVRRVGVRVD